MDRIDMHIEVPAVSLEEMKAAPGEPSRAVAERVVAARRIQEERFGASCSTPINAAMSSREVQSHCRLDPEAQKLLDAAYESFRLSARALIRILKVARSIADLQPSDSIAPAHLAEAIQYRSLDRRSSV